MATTYLVKCGLGCIHEAPLADTWSGVIDRLMEGQYEHLQEGVNTGPEQIAEFDPDNRQPFGDHLHCVDVSAAAAREIVRRQLTECVSFEHRPGMQRFIDRHYVGPA